VTVRNPNHIPGKSHAHFVALVLQVRHIKRPINAAHSTLKHQAFKTIPEIVAG
jgi:hypothetical protein